MSFTIPEMPLTCAIWTGPWLSKVYRADSVCNLGQGKRIIVEPGEWATPAAPLNNVGQLLLPAGTDIRDMACVGAVADMVEVPKGTGRWYQVLSVDDMGKGFANEHRWAFIAKASEPADNVNYAGLFWPVPIP